MEELDLSLEESSKLRCEGWATLSQLLVSVRETHIFFTKWIHPKPACLHYLLLKGFLLWPHDK